MNQDSIINLIQLYNQYGSQCAITFKKITRIVLFSFLMSCEQSQEVNTQDSLFGVSKQSNKTNTQPYGFDSEFNYPSFSGQYPVATLEMTVTDNSRLELFSNKTTNTNTRLDSRRFNIRFYYPSAEAKLNIEDFKNSSGLVHNSKLPVISETAWANLIGPQIKLGKMLRYSNYENAFWNIKKNQQISSKQTDFPLLIFSHGYGYSPEAYTALSAELASQGYIVISINHTFGANPTKLLGDKTKTQWAKKLPRENIGQYLPTWSDDQIFVIEELYRLNSELSSPFYGRLNLSQLGIFGHSYGGAAAYLTAARDPRIKAIMDIDGTLFEAGNFDLYQPLALLLSKNHSPTINTDRLHNDAFIVKLNQFEHISFTDHILWWQWDFGETDLDTGNIDALEAVENTSTLVKSFFDAYLLSDNKNWLLLTQENNSIKQNERIK
ncbi:MAG: pimeloyl-ACP methyl ester carboxylesterase [Polaribacter sp.]|jgi:pimeloyl-ACP methyl ester carboxylesterase